MSSITPATIPSGTPPLPVAWIMMLGLMVAIGPLSIDMYLPALPTMADSFGVSTAFIANSVPAYFIGLVVGQLFYGPYSDHVGRVKPLYIGMTLYVIASLICVTTHSASILFLGRTLQALGACVGTVVARAAIRDRLSAQQTAQAFSIMVLVMGVAPILAPSLGTLLLKFFSWHVIFWFLAAFGIFNLILTRFFFFETLQPQHRNRRPAHELISQYIDLIKDKTFLNPALGGGLLMGAMFVYVGAAPELLMDTYGITATHFSWIFGMNAAGFIGLTQVNQRLIRYYSLTTLLRAGAIVQVLASGGLLLLGLIWGTQALLPLVLGCIFCCLAGLGITQPNAGAISLAFQKKRAGMASALQGALQFSVGIFGGLLLNLLEVNAVLKLGLTMFGLMAVGTILVWRLDKRLDLSQIE